MLLHGLKKHRVGGVIQVLKFFFKKVYDVYMYTKLLSVSMNIRKRRFNTKLCYESL